MFALLLVCWLYDVSSLITKQIILTPRTPIQNESFVRLNTHTTSTVADTYYIISANTHSQDSYDVNLSFDKSYGFDSSSTSQFSLTMNGFTPFTNNQNTDILFVFSVNNIEYFSFLLHLNDHKYNNMMFNKIYISNTNTTNTINNEWIVLNEYEAHESIWPLKFTITNHPNHQHSVFEFYHNKSDTSSIRYELDKLFEANKGIDIYLIGHSINQQFYISSFDILVSKNMSTYQPTSDPTPQPTVTPIVIPLLANYSNRINNTKATINLTEMIYLSETYTQTQTQTRTHNTLIIINGIKSQAIIVICTILLSATIFCVITIGIRKYCKPIGVFGGSNNNNNRNKNESESDTDTDSSNSNNNDNEYMNEGILSPTGSIAAGDIKNKMFANNSNVNINMKMGAISKYNTVISNVTSWENAQSANNIHDNNAAKIGNVSNKEHSSTQNTVSSISVSSDNTLEILKMGNSLNTSKSSNSECIIPLAEKQIMDKFIEMINDKRKNMEKFGNDNQQIISRKVSDEIGNCVSFNYSDTMLS